MIRSIVDASTVSLRGRTSLLTLALCAGLAGGAPGCVLEESLSDSDAAEEEIAVAEQALGVENLAFEKPTSQSSIAFGGVPSRAVDGNPNGNWGTGSVTHTNTEYQPWWQVDLQSVQPIGSVVLFNRTDCCADRLSNFKVSVSNDNVNWHYSVEYAGTAPPQLAFAIDRAARYVKVQLQGTNVLSLAEVKVYRPGVAPNLALSRPTTQSSTAAGGVASRAVDSSTNGNWPAGSVTHTNTEYQPWWRVDLESVQPIGSVVLFNRTDCCADRLSNFKLLVSDDGSDWQEYTYSGVASPQVTFQVGRSGRFVKVQLQGTNALSLAEVQVLPPVVTDSQWHHLCSRETGRLLEGGGGSYGLVPWSGAMRQFWKIEPSTGGTYRLQSRQDGTYFTDLSYTDPFWGFVYQELGMTSAADHSSQRWQIPDAAGEYVTMLTPNLGEYMRDIGGGISLGTWTGTASDYWRIMPSEPSRTEAAELFQMRPSAASDVIPAPPAMTSFAQPPGTTAEVLLGDTAIPYMNVEDRGAAWQVKNSPYYRLSRYAFWKRVFYGEFEGVVTTTKEAKEDTGYTLTSSRTVQESFNVTVTASASFSFGPASANLSVTVSRDLMTSETNTQEWAKSYKTTVARTNHPSPNRTALAVYLRADRYVLLAADGQEVTKWVYVDPNVEVERSFQVLR